MVMRRLGFCNLGLLPDWRWRMSKAITTALFGALVRQLGGVDAAAAVLEARYGVGCKGTVSKMCAGQIGVTVDAAVAIEDALGVYTITGQMFARQSDAAAVCGSISELTAQSAVTAGMAHSILVRALSRASDGGDAITRGEAVAAVSEAIALRDLAGRIVIELEAVIGVSPAFVRRK